MLELCIFEREDGEIVSAISWHDAIERGIQRRTHSYQLLDIAVRYSFSWSRGAWTTMAPSPESEVKFILPRTVPLGAILLPKQ